MPGRNRRKISTNTPSERRVGYSRAVVIGEQRLYVSGTTSVDENGETQGESLYEQTKYIFSKLDGVLNEAGFSKRDVVLVRAYLVKVEQIAEFDRAFNEEFSDVNPCCTLVGVYQLVSPNLLIEIEYVADKG